MKLPRLDSMIFKATIFSALGATMLVACNQGSSSHPSTPPPGSGVIVTSQGEIIPAGAVGAGQYNGADLDPYAALNDYGSWQNIGQERYFVPRGVDANWQPYQNGYWSFDEERGWSFVSQDRWGWLTEHNGIWRHHNHHGWVWFPFPDRHYEPSVVTWFDQGDYIGWYPYHEKYGRFYVNGFGFDDGFWAGGYRPVINLGFSSPNFFLGIVLVNRVDVTRPNIMNYIIRDRALIRNIAITAHSEERIRQGLIGPIPGGNLAKSHEFIQHYAAIQAPVGHAQTITSKGGAKIIQPFMPVGGHPGLAANNKGREDNNRPPAPRAENHQRPATPAPATQAPRVEQQRPVQRTESPSTTQTPPPAPAKPSASLNGMQPRPQAQSQSSTSTQDNSDRRRNEMHNPSMKTETHTDDRGNSVSITRRADDNSPAPVVHFNRVQSSSTTSSTPSDSRDDNSRNDNGNSFRRGRQAPQ